MNTPRVGLDARWLKLKCATCAETASETSLSASADTGFPVTIPFEDDIE